jgi:hypothetical protein
LASAIQPDVVAEARRLTDLARDRAVELRPIGGVAIALHAPGGIPAALARSYADIDLVSGRKAGRDTSRLLEEAGYEPNERFNTLNGSTRLVYYDRDNGRRVDVFVGEFRMCHVVPLAGRLQIDPQTVPLAELLLTKLQIVQLNEKDLKDIWALVLAHDVADHDDDAINAEIVARVLAGDWGFWRTSRESVDVARDRLPSSGLGPDDQAAVSDRLERLWIRVEREPKSLRWRSRAKLGERTRWYEEPEEIAHGG